MGRDNERDADTSESELHIEVAPLSPTQPAAGAHAQTARPGRRRRAWRLLAASAFLLALAVLVGSLPPVRTALIGQSRTATAPRAATSLRTLGAVPASCPPGNSVYTFSSMYGPGAGVSGLNIWLVGFNGSNTTLLLGGASPTALGWPRKLIVVAAPDVTQPLTLSVRPLVAGTAWLSPGDISKAVVMLTFDPSTTPASADGWRSWPLQLYLPAAGCYYLRIEYGGQDTPGMFFAAGE